MIYCVYGCVNGWIETDSEIGTTCPEHSPTMPHWAGKPTVQAVASLEGGGYLTGWEKVPYEDYLASDEWQRKQRHALIRADFICSVCRKRGVPLDVHHLTYARRGQELPDDLVVLCRRCHGATHELLGDKS